MAEMLELSASMTEASTKQLQRVSDALVKIIEADIKEIEMRRRAGIHLVPRNRRGLHLTKEMRIAGGKARIASALRDEYGQLMSNDPAKLPTSEVRPSEEEDESNPVERQSKK